jgi:uncharacterized protein
VKRFRWLLTAAVLATAAFGLASAAAGADALPSAPRRWVTDDAGFLSPGARETLDSRLEQYERSTGHQVLVWITRSSGNFTAEDFAAKAFESWRVGRSGIDDGVVLFVFADDRKLRFEVGYGLESTITDAVAGRILRDSVVPRIQAGDQDGAILQGIDALISTIDGTASAGGESPAPGAAQERPQQERGQRKLTTGEKIIIGLLVIGFIILLITNPSLALWLLFNLLAGGRGGGGGGGGGGFSGGGGRSGGGGASGSW